MVAQAGVRRRGRGRRFDSSWGALLRDYKTKMGSTFLLLKSKKGKPRPQSRSGRGEDWVRVGRSRRPGGLAGFVSPSHRKQLDCSSLAEVHLSSLVLIEEVKQEWRAVGENAQLEMVDSSSTSGIPGHSPASMLL